MKMFLTRWTEKTNHNTLGSWLACLRRVVVGGVLLFAALALSGCGIAPEDIGELDGVGQKKQQLIFNGEDWDLLTKFDNHSTYRIGALYGRAVASIGLCSGWLIDDEILVTAHHCRRSSTTEKVTFGRYGDTYGNYARGLREARDRLIDLGVPSTAVYKMSTDTLQKWDCDRIDSDYNRGKRDVDYWRCRPKTITYTRYVQFRQYGVLKNANRTHTLHLLPGHLYGHFNVSPGRRSEKTKLYSVSYNRRNAQPASDLSVLFSPGGWITDAYDNPMTGALAKYDNAFEFIGNDTVCGSSGGVILDRRTHKAFGVVSGAYGKGEKCDRSSYDVNSWTVPTFYSNVGAYITSQASTYANTSPRRLSLSTSTGRTGWVGGTGGTRYVMPCPTGYFAAGIVGSTSTHGYVGNFGLVCLPYWKHTEYQLDRAKVMAGGSYDTKRGYHYQKDFNTYMHETLTSHPGPLAPQQLTMCAPGYYLRGVVSRAGSYVNRITAIECSKIHVRTSYGDEAQFFYSILRRPIGTRNEGNVINKRCPEGYAISGMDINAGAHTDGFRFHCKPMRLIP